MARFTGGDDGDDINSSFTDGTGTGGTGTGT